MQAKIKCVECRQACLSEYGGADVNATKLIFIKSRGGLIIPSKDVSDLCIAAEKYMLQYNHVADLKKLNSG
jgi:hypothetical protein